MANAIALLADTAPHWISINSRSDSNISLLTAGKHLSGEPLRQYHLSVAFGWGSLVLAREVAERRLLPANCMQRHMNTDGSFCIGHEAPSLVVDHVTAEQWWNLLLGYLRCQDIAEITKRWPPNRGLSHGDAAKIQLEAEALADKLGVLVQYRETIEYGAPWPPMDMPESDDLTKLLELEKIRQQLDMGFVRYVDYPCCGTMSGCPINAGAADRS